MAVEADVTDSDACRAMVAAVVREFGRLDILVNCAGVTRFIPHADMDDVRDEDWDFILGVNVKGTFQLRPGCSSGHGSKRRSDRQRGQHRRTQRSGQFHSLRRLEGRRHQSDDGPWLASSLRKSA